MRNFLDEIKSLTNTAEQNKESEIKREQETRDRLVAKEAKEYCDYIKECIRISAEKGQFELIGDTYILKGYTQVPLYGTNLEMYEGTIYRPVYSIDQLRACRVWTPSKSDHTTCESKIFTAQCDYYKRHNTLVGYLCEWSAAYTLKPDTLKCIALIKNMLACDNIQVSNIWVIKKWRQDCGDKGGELLSVEVIPSSEQITVKQSNKEYIEIYETFEFIYKYK